MGLVDFARLESVPMRHRWGGITFAQTTPCPRHAPFVLDLQEFFADALR